ncbi:hypothetical protein [Kocuria flava]|uniref:hypothetical protein n=1 Tax=Kocuria flava TaxID=446860 RepID=UPI002F924E36
MTAVKKWVAAGSSAAVLAGGLFLGAPAAHADTCVPAGASPAVTNLITSADHLYDAGVHFNSLVEDPQVLAELQAQQAVLEDAIVNDDTMDRARGAWGEILRLQEAYAASSGDQAVQDAYAATQAAAQGFEAAAVEARQQGEVYMEDGADLVGLFQSTCGGLLPTGGTGEDWSEDDGDWAGGDDWGGDDSAPATGSNEGWNVDTAAEDSGSTGLIAGLLAAGGAAAAAVALRLRRRA